MQYILAERAKTLKASEIRELLKVTEQPEIISFAGGLPDPALFPIEELAKMSQTVFATDAHAALQYGPTEGYGLLRDIIAYERMAKAKVISHRDETLITAGSQQGIEFCARLFLNDGDYIICEDPSYLGAINVFDTYHANYLTVPMDEDGMIIEELEQILQSNHKPKFIYTIPDFQNPTGITMSIERRKRLVKLATQYKIPIIEDNPYGDVVFSGERNPALKSFDTDGWVIFLGTFSKTLCPGLRVGWVCANQKLLHKFIMLKQVADLQCNTLTQREIGLYLKTYNIDEHISKIIEVYTRRRNLMLASIKQYFAPDIKCTSPNGGLFTWVKLPENIDAAELLVVALEEKVAFVPGAPFFPNKNHKNFLRLNYSNMPDEKIKEGIKRLAHVIERFR